jgi:hypothetical protein
MKGTVWASLVCFVVLASAAAGCESDAEGEEGGGGGAASWSSGSCGGLGAETAPSGACLYSDCASCPSGTQCGNQYHRYCRVDFCSTAADCGPTGWVCDYGSCFFPCNAPASGPGGGGCPADLECNQNSITGHPNFCITGHATGGNSCGSCRTCYSGCSSECTGMYVPASCVTTCMAACDKCCN